MYNQRIKFDSHLRSYHVQQILNIRAVNLKGRILLVLCIVYSTSLQYKSIDISSKWVGNKPVRLNVSQTIF